MLACVWKGNRLAVGDQLVVVQQIELKTLSSSSQYPTAEKTAILFVEFRLVESKIFQSGVRIELKFVIRVQRNQKLLCSLTRVIDDAKIG